MDVVVRNRIGIIPARSGSKRIPNKNIYNFAGKPMLAWTIKAALDSGIFSRVLVSTDSEEYATIAREWGAFCPFLRETSSDDLSPVSSATIAALLQAEIYWNESYTDVYQLMPTCPLRTGNDIRNSMKHFEENNYQFQISAGKLTSANVWWTLTLDEKGNATRLFPESFTSRSQDLAPLFCPSGAVWIARRDELIESKTFYGPHHKFFELPWESAIDIDTWDDLRMASLCV